MENISQIYVISAEQLSFAPYIIVRETEENLVDPPPLRITILFYAEDTDVGQIVIRLCHDNVRKEGYISLLQSLFGHGNGN